MNRLQALIARDRIDQFLAGRAQQVMSESMHQQTIISWCHMETQLDPACLYQWVHAVPNSAGLLHKATAGRLKGEGLKAGVFDLNLDVARGGFNGLKIELKVPAQLNAKGSPIPSSAGVPSDDQLRWQAFYRQQGFMAEICWGFQPAIEMIKGYVAGDIARRL